MHYWSRENCIKVECRSSVEFTLYSFPPPFVHFLPSLSLPVITSSSIPSVSVRKSLKLHFPEFRFRGALS